MTFTIDQGRRADVVFGPYGGCAAINEAETEVAFPGKARDFRRVTSGMVDGAAFAVLAAADGTVKGMVVLTVRADD